MSAVNNEVHSYGFYMRDERFAQADGFLIEVLTKNPKDSFPLNPRDIEHEIWNASKKNAGMAMAIKIRVYQGTYGPVIVYAHYSNLHLVDLKQVYAMEKTLRAIEKQVEKDKSESDLGDYLMSVAKAINITSWFVPDHENFSSYPNTAWNEWPITTLRDKVRGKIKAMIVPDKA